MDDTMAFLPLINARVVGKTILALATIDCALVGLGLILTPTTIRASGHGLLGVVAGLVMLAAKRLLVSGVTFVTAALIFYFIPGISVDVEAQTEHMESRLHAVERVPSEGWGKPAQFVPIRFIPFNKLTKNDRLLVAFDALILSEVLGREVSASSRAGANRPLLRRTISACC